ncbi:hypothetical protein [Powai lake megavirus]|uniref:Uncharacterized protein n=1 Tax=Powai lake megavirus TaxID=1842663 RepID=A0A167RD05_9VIRU|nr:hypothetical protein QJ849_gp383 [Powai lake megavirus]ANB50545.1 hypothetical protein [Powai lake megavirus]
MNIGNILSDFKNHKKFWFYVRKGIFQVLLQLLLAIMSIWDYAQQSGKTNDYAYNNLYFYTSLLLLLYTGLKYILEYVFSICSTDIAVKKNPKYDVTTMNLFTSFNMTNQKNYHNIIIIKRIFKLIYSQYNLFRYINKLCWFMGIDSPILIPFNVAIKLGNINNDLSYKNQDAYLNVTLTNLYSYHPVKFNNNIDYMDPIISVKDSDLENLIPRTVITSMDKSINILQQELFDY